MAWETTHWDKSKNNQLVTITHGDNNQQDFRLYSVVLIILGNDIFRG
ncbi:hypothetical protein SRDD_09990 [Serratia sp. DD3]|nr:hypothetical protein SRDD_09990 [Serratia sp. DD3]